MSGSSASHSPDIACASSLPLDQLLGAAACAASVKQECDEELHSYEGEEDDEAAEGQSGVNHSGESGQQQPGKLSPSVASMIDATDFRAMQPEPTYQTLTSVAERMSPPGFSPSSSYATLTPLQPLPPISTMSDKFVYGGHAASAGGHGGQSGVSGSFAVMQNNNGVVQVGSSAASQGGLANIGLGGIAGSPYGYDKLPSMGMSPPHNYPSPSAGLQPSPLSPQSAYSQSALSSPHKSASPHYEPAFLPRMQHSPQALSPPSPPTAQRISAELKRYSIPQAIFAQRVLCRSQGTLSDLLRNPKPWSKLKSGRETFRRMWKWLQEPEFQRMSALRLAG
ncbi:hypothetical protein QAD02_022992 [Eretmocerus hayati]|uniref:Uncharacterized protein n=1 Tax=Eretmocerus hayati TaxID=131215 RepID=A0ACC2PVP3_9HYME|nr:hypothetical protein QAD02_022992 [Eretmocerus hayati]